MKTLRLASCALPVALLAACGGGDALDGQSLAQATQASATTKATRVAADYTNIVQYMYVAYYGRPGDPSGLAFWAGYLADPANGSPPTDLPTFKSAYGTQAAVNIAVKTVMDNFGKSAESVALYGTDNGAIVDAIYQNLFNRAPDAGGRKFYVDALNAKLIAPAQAAVEIAVGAQGTDAVAIQNKVAAATQFTAGLTAQQASAYSGLDVNSRVRSALSAVGSTSNITAAVSSMIAALSSTGGSASACIADTSLIAQTGTTWVFHYRTTEGTSVTTADSTGTVNGLVSFQGTPRTEIQFSGLGTVNGVTGNATGKIYISYANLVESTYGMVGTGSYAGYTANFTTVYSPAEITRFDLSTGQGYTQTYTETTNTTVVGLPISIPPTVSTHTVTTTYVGQESVTVPAGTFNTCKFSIQRSTTTNGSTSTSPLLTQWMATGKGIQVKQISAGSNGSPDSITELTGGSINGGPLQ